jgi:hypothetical protein
MPGATGPSLMDAVAHPRLIEKHEPAFLLEACTEIKIFIATKFMIKASCSLEDIAPHEHG